MTSGRPRTRWRCTSGTSAGRRSEEHTSELQSRSDLVCRLLLEKKKHTTRRRTLTTHHKPQTTHAPEPAPNENPPHTNERQRVLPGNVLATYYASPDALAPARIH